MDKCSFCGVDTRPGDTYCLNCGQRVLPLPEPPTVRESLPLPTAQAALDRLEKPARLVRRAENGETIQEYLLDKAEIVIGRASTSDILLPKDKLTSRWHATIRYEGNQYYLYDERSANGTFGNGNQLDERVPYLLHNGDHVGIGEHELVFYAYNFPMRQQTALDRLEKPARLVRRTENGETIQEYLLDKAEIVIGRAPTSDILLPKDKLTSRRHAAIRYEGNQYYLYDEHSANGTFVNGNQLAERVPYLLHNGDHVGIGEHELVFYAYNFPMRQTISFNETPLSHQTQLATLPFCHVLTTDIAPARAVSWLRGAAAAGWPLPLALAHDLGLLLSQPANRFTLVKPSYLPFDEDTSAYHTFLQRMAAHSLVRDLPSWSPPLSDAVLSILLARLVEGLDLPQDYRLPSGPDGVRFLQALDHELAHTDPATLWQQIPPDARPSWRYLLTPQALTRLERNLQALDREELRFLTQYGAPMLGSPDPRTLLDLLALTGLPASARLALTQTLRFLPQVSASANHRLGGIQTYPEGGYEGLARQGSLESLLPSENVYTDELFLHRVLNHEALYYGRERPREQRRELAYLVGQLGWGLGGDGQVLVRALLLALGQAMRQRGYEVFYSLAGATLSEPHSLEKPAEVGRLLYAQERGAVNSEAVLQGVLEQLRAWRDDYRGWQVLWVLSEDFDRDDVREHETLYQALQAEGEQQVWYVRVGPVATRPQGAELPSVTARYFGRWQVVESGRLWEREEAGKR